MQEFMVVVLSKCPNLLFSTLLRNEECVTIGPCEGEATTSNSPSLFHWGHFGEEHT